jgi:AraC family transcriptional regulator
MFKTSISADDRIMPVDENSSHSPWGLTAPLLFLSSEDAGWEDIVIRAYHEPMELEGWIESDLPDTTLVLLTRGSMLIEQRRHDGTWKGQSWRQGDFSLKPGNTISNEVRWRTLSPEPMQTLHIQLNQHLLARTAEDVAGRAATRLTLVRRSGFQDPLLAQIGLALWRELECPTNAGKLYAQTAAQMLAVHLLRHYGAAALPINPPQHSQGLTRPQINRVTEFIRVHLTDDLSLEDLARQVGFSAYHFARLFRQATGHSPHQFVLLQRLEHAQNLLKKTDLSLTDVALESGFANQSHLTQVFKRRLGITPRTYRQTHTPRAHF